MKDAVVKNRNPSLCGGGEGLTEFVVREGNAENCAAEGVSAAVVAARIVSGGTLTPGEALALLRRGGREELREAAHCVTVACSPMRFDFCAIVNARSGRCSEDCRWCAQSAHWHTDAPCHGWIGTAACLEAAKAAEAAGAERLGIVTSGRGPTAADLEDLCEALRALKRGSGLRLCASVGLLSEEALRRLRDAGLRRVHCNLETAPSLFPSLCSTHGQEQKNATLRTARRLGLEICCGGILGLGESDEQLVEFAFALAAIGPDSIPVNILHPIAGTPMEGQPPVSVERILDAISILRLANPRASLRFAGGRARLSGADALRAMRCGIDAGIVGYLLTTRGGAIGTDRELAREAGYEVGG